MVAHPSTFPFTGSSLSRREQVGVGFLFVLAALILAPTFARGVACGHDTFTHYYRIVQVALNAQNGAPFSLFSPDFMRGYGYTIFPFYAPLSYWGTAAFVLLGLDAAAALGLVAWLTLWLAAWGAYNLGRRVFQPPGAFVSGLAYLFAPYLLHNATQRGAFPELLGLGLLPWALVAGDLALARRTPRAIVLAALAFAPLILAHNIMPNFGFAIFLALALSYSCSLRPSELWAALRPGLAVVALALAITAFFWLPAYVELDFTQSRRVDSPFADWPHYGQHFVAWTDVVGWPLEPADLALTNPPLRTSLALGTAVLALAGLGMLLFKRSRQRFLLCWACVTAVSLFLASPSSAWLWTILPLPEFVQLPFRFLGPASLGAALLAGAGVEIGVVRQGRKPARWPRPDSDVFLLVSALIVSATGWFWLYPPVCPMPDQETAVTVAGATVWDETGRIQQWGGDSLGETLPRWVDKLPEPDAFLPAYAAGKPINRLILPETARLLSWESWPQGDRYHLLLSEPATLTYRSFYVPYWRATFDSKPLPLSPRPGDGLIQVTLPAGEGELALSFGLTPLRYGTLFFSALAVLAVVWWVRRRAPATAFLPAPGRPQWVLLVTLILLLALVFFLVHRTNNPIHAARLQNGNLTRVANPAHISFSGEFIYLGYNGPRVMAAQETAVFTYYWRAQREIGVPYGFQMSLADDQGRTWNLPSKRPAGYADLPGKPGWRFDGYARDAYQIDLLPGTPPGVYWLEVEGFRRDIAAALLPQDWPTGPNPARARVGQVQVTPGRWRLNAENAFVDTFAPTPLVDYPGLQLLGWTAPQAVWRPGAEAEVQLLWQQEGKSTKRPSPIFLSLSNAGTEAARLTITPGGDHYPMTLWPDRAVVRDMIQWRLPAVLDSGHYTLQLHASNQVLSLGTWQIEAPPRSFVPLLAAHTAVFTVPFAALQGYNLEETAVGPGETLHLELVWQALETAPQSYRVFVHLLDGDGNLVTQSDAVPDNWTRPTTGWVPGEYIRDRHTLAVPPDAPFPPYRLRLGWYDAATGTRLSDTTIDLGANP